MKKYYYQGRCRDGKFQAKAVLKNRILGAFIAIGVIGLLTYSLSVVSQDSRFWELVKRDFGLSSQLVTASQAKETDETLVRIEPAVTTDWKNADEKTIRNHVLATIEAAGLDKYEAYEIVNCESKFNPEAINVNKNGTVDLGVWQINTVHKEDISPSCALDIDCATQWAIEKRKKDGNWSAWVCAKLRGVH